MVTANLFSCHDEATLHAPPKRVLRADDLTSAEFRHHMRHCTHVRVEGDGWCFGPDSGEPSIPCGLYAKDDFLSAVELWESKEPW